MANLNNIIERLITLTNDLTNDIPLASTRLEHIRITTRANEASNILTDLMNLDRTQPDESQQQAG